MQGQAELEWAGVVAAEGPARLFSQAMGRLFGAEREAREQILEGAMFGLHMERAAARRERGRLQERQGWVGGVPPRPGRVEVCGAPRGCSAAHPGPGNSANSDARGDTTASRSLWSGQGVTA